MHGLPDVHHVLRSRSHEVRAADVAPVAVQLVARYPRSQGRLPEARKAAKPPMSPVLAPPTRSASTGSRPPAATSSRASSSPHSAISTSGCSIAFTSACERSHSASAERSLPISTGFTARSRSSSRSTGTNFASVRTSFRTRSSGAVRKRYFDGNRRRGGRGPSRATYATTRLPGPHNVRTG